MPRVSDDSHGSMASSDTCRSTPPTHVVSDAERALLAGDWEDARATFEGTLDGHQERPRAPDGLGRALWWLGNPDGAIEHRERAFVLLKASDPVHAGRSRSGSPASTSSVYGNEAVANGWLSARAQRLLSDAGPERGWLEIVRGRASEDPAVARTPRARSRSTSPDGGDADLEVAALAEIGLAEIQVGKVESGLDHLDEAMAAATGGEADMLETVAETCWQPRRRAG